MAGKVLYAFRVTGRILLAMVLFVVVLAVVVSGVVVLGVNTPYGHDLLQSAARLGGVEITGLEGHFPDDITADHITVADAQGIWLEIDRLKLDWSPTALLHKEIRASVLSATRVHVQRYPSGAASNKTSQSSSGGFDYRVAVDQVKIDAIELPELTLSLSGRATYQPGQVPAVVDVQIAAASPDAAGQGPASVTGTLSGPLNDATVHLVVNGRGLSTKATGTVDLVGLSGDIKLAIDHPDIAGVSASRLDAAVKGNAATATLHAVVAGLKLPGAQPAVLGDGPLILDATYVKGATPDVSATLTAGATSADGFRIAADAQVTLASMAAKLNLQIDRLAVAGVAAQRIEAHAQGDEKALDLHGVLTGLVAPGTTTAMIGTAPLTLDAHYRQGGTPEIAVQLTGDTVLLTASGASPTKNLALDTHVVLPKLEAFAPTITGHADLAGRIDGTLDDFAVKATGAMAVTVGGVASSIDGTIDASGLPNTPSGAAAIKGAYGKEPISLDVTAAMGADKLTHIAISDASFRGVKAKGDFTLATDGGLPTGQLTIEAQRLPPPASSGAARATIKLSRVAMVPLLKVIAEVTSVTVQGTRLARSVLTGTVTDPIGPTPVLQASLTVDGVRSGTFSQNARLDMSGPQNALVVRLGVSGTATLTAEATLDVPASRLKLSSLQGTARGQTLRLAAPTFLTYAPDVTLGATHITLGGSTLDIAGRLLPTLDLTAALLAVPAELAKLVDPKLVVEGSLQAQARVQGTTSAPTGTLRVTGSGLRLRDPRGIPAVRIDANAELAGGRARIDATILAGTAQLHLAGLAPITAGGAWDMTARGNAGLGLLDPFLTGAGAQTRGQMAFDVTLTGTAPTPAGTLTLRNGSVTIPAQGVRISDIQAQVRADTGRVLLESLTAKAGTGTLGGSGSVDLASPMAIDLKFNARHASPLASDLLTATLDADLGLTGALQTGMSANGKITITRADINIPQRLPSSLPLLNVRQPGPPPPPAAPEVPINLDISLEAPGQIYIRGRGLDAELGGRLHIGGTAAAPRPDGGFALRRGTFSIAGQSLNFTTGKIGFDGNVPIDPSLNFAATTLTSKMAATLAVTGTATKPRIALSSVPELPQDEVLAQLLFRRSAADLSAFQLAEIAAALAQLADVGGSGGIDPLGTLRKGLGLDVLSVGGSPGSASPTIEAGRNIARGVYLGAKQSTSGSGSQATVRIDLATGLRLEADVGVGGSSQTTTTPGAPPTGNQVGITYEFDY